MHNTVSLHASFSTRPLYLQVRDLLLSRILAREWAPGQMVPNEADTATSLGVSIGTVRKAMDTLEQEQVLVRRQGRGTFLVDQSSATFASRFSNICSKNGKTLEGVVQVKSIEAGFATPEELERLELKADSEVHRITRVFRLGSRPFMVESMVLSAKMIEIIPANFGSYQINTLAQQNGIILKEASEGVSVCVAADEDAKDLDVDAGSPLLCLDRVLRSIKDLPVEWRRARCNLGEQKYVATLA